MSYSYITISLLAAGLLNILPTSGPELAGEAECVSKLQTVRFSEYLVADNYGYTFGVAAADLDGDGDLDLTSPDIQKKKQFSTMISGRDRHLANPTWTMWCTTTGTGDGTGVTANWVTMVSTHWISAAGDSELIIPFA